jgi:hypothetical protein
MPATAIDPEKRFGAPNAVSKAAANRNQRFRFSHKALAKVFGARMFGAIQNEVLPLSPTA